MLSGRFIPVSNLFATVCLLHCYQKSNLSPNFYISLNEVYQIFMVGVRIAVVSLPVLVCFQCMKSRGCRNVQSKHIHVFTHIHTTGVRGQEKGTCVDLKLESGSKEGRASSGEWVSLSLRPDIIKNLWSPLIILHLFNSLPSAHRHAGANNAVRRPIWHTKSH